MPKRIKCTNLVTVNDDQGNPVERECGSVFAHLISDKTIDIRRKHQNFLITGNDYSVIGTCPRCEHRTSLVVTKGVVDLTDVEFKEDNPAEPKTPSENGDKPQEGDGSAGDTPTKGDGSAKTPEKAE
jgi:hypothetical protein